MRDVDALNATRSVRRSVLERARRAQTMSSHSIRQYVNAYNRDDDDHLYHERVLNHTNYHLHC